MQLRTERGLGPVNPLPPTGAVYRMKTLQWHTILFYKHHVKLSQLILDKQWSWHPLLERIHEIRQLLVWKLLVTLRGGHAFIVFIVLTRGHSFNTWISSTIMFKSSYMIVEHLYLIIGKANVIQSGTKKFKWPWGGRKEDLNSRKSFESPVLLRLTNALLLSLLTSL